MLVKGSSSQNRTCKDEKIGNEYRSAGQKQIAKASVMDMNAADLKAMQNDYQKC
jgi:hypothetical protein